MVVFARRSARISRLVLRIAIVTALCGSLIPASIARADILFEGYSKVLLSDKHVGYVVQRYEFDPKKQEFSTAYYLKTNAAGGNITESLKARATSSLKPVSFQYTELSGGKARMIDATFKGDMMTAVVTNGGSKNTISKKLPKGAFLSSFLVYLMLQGKEGIKSGVKYGYQAIAEEDGNLYTGEAFISGEEPVGNINAFKVLNTFKGSRFVSYVTPKGEIVATKSPVQQVATELVPVMQDATAGMSFTPSNLTLLFGSVPKGTENSVSRRAAATPNLTTGKASPTPGQAGAEKQKKLMETPPPSDESPKKSGVPGGKGIQIKGAAPSPETSGEEGQ